MHFRVSTSLLFFKKIFETISVVCGSWHESRRGVMHLYELAKVIEMIQTSGQKLTKPRGPVLRSAQKPIWADVYITWQN